MVAGPKGQLISCDLPEHRSVPTAAQHCQLHGSGKAASQPAGRLKLGSLKWNRNHLKGKGSLIYPTCEETTSPLITPNYLHIFQYLFWELLPRMTARLLGEVPLLPVCEWSNVPLQHSHIRATGNLCVWVMASLPLRICQNSNINPIKPWCFIQTVFPTKATTSSLYPSEVLCGLVDN